MYKVNIAILGSTSNIAKGLISRLIHVPSFHLHLFTRSTDRTNSFLATNIVDAVATYEIIEGYSNFYNYTFDVIINCIGVGTEKKLQGDYAKYFAVSEEYDHLVLNYLNVRCPEALYIAFSSGAVYGSNFSVPASEDTANCIRVNHVSPQNYYGITRIYSEAKHRAYKNLRIVDLRVFSYFSRFSDVTEGYFLTDVVDCILNNKVLKTDRLNIVRDYIHPDDLCSLIILCIQIRNINTAFDVISTKPVKKYDILEYFRITYGLKYEMITVYDNASPTGIKKIYCSEYQQTEKIKFVPKYSSMDTIKQESEPILRIYKR